LYPFLSFSIDEVLPQVAELAVLNFLISITELTRLINLLTRSLSFSFSNCICCTTGEIARSFVVEVGDMLG